MKPLRDLVLLEECEIEHKEPGRLIEIVTMQKKSDDGDNDGMTAGRVVDMGDGAWDSSGQQFLEPKKLLEMGKPYLLNRLGNYRYQIGMKKYLLCRLSNVYARLDDSEVR